MAAYYVFRGNTSRNKDLLGRHGLGATWNPEDKVWMMQGGGNGLDRKFATLRRSGVKIERSTTAPEEWTNYYGE